MQGGLFGAEPEMMGRHAVPAVTFGQHLGQQAGSLLRGGAPARKTAFAGELAEGGRIAAADEVRLAHEDRPIGHEPPEHLSPANDRLFVCRVGLGQGVCLVRIVAPERLLVMHAVDRQRLVHKAIAAIDHYRPRGIQRRHLAGRPGDLRLHGLVKTEVAGIDEGDLVLDRPDEDRGVVAFLLDPRLQLFDPVVKELLAVGQLVQIIGPLSVEDAAAANDDSRASIRSRAFCLSRPPNCRPQNRHMFWPLARHWAMAAWGSFPPSLDVQSAQSCQGTPLSLNCRPFHSHSRKPNVVGRTSIGWPPSLMVVTSW